MGNSADASVFRHQYCLDYSTELLHLRGSFLAVPGKVYRCQSGSKIEKVLGVRPYTVPFNFIALVQYDDGTLEIVPTRTVAETDPKVGTKMC